MYVSLISTKNEVFSVKGLAVDNVDLQTVINTAGTIKILKYDTKTAVTPAKAEAPKAATQAAPEKKAETAEAQKVVVVYDEGGMSVKLYFNEAEGVFHDANGNKFIPMNGPIVYQPDSNSYWSSDPSFWNTHTEAELKGDADVDANVDADTDADAEIEADAEAEELVEEYDEYEAADEDVDLVEENDEF